MDKTAGDIQLLSASPEGNSWQRAVAQVADLCGGNVWDLPLWILPDGRHKQAAEMTLLRVLGLSALPTNRIQTLLSIAGDILDLPVLDTVIRPEHVELALAQIHLSESTDAYKAAWDTPGFAQSFWAAVQEAESRGHFPGETISGAAGPQPPPQFRDLHRLLKAHFDRTKRLTPGEFLRRARSKLLDGYAKFDDGRPLVIGPLFELNPLEMEFVRTLISSPERAHILPVQGVKWANEIGFSNRPSDENTHSATDLHLIRPLTPELELEDVFAQIAGWVASRRYKYRDIRVIHPLLHEAISQIRSAAKRYKVPLKVSTSMNLAEFPGVIQLENLLDLFAGGWKRTDILGILRSRIVDAPQEEVSTLIARILETGETASSPPGHHWITLAERTGVPATSIKLKKLHELEISSRNRQTGAVFTEWVKRCIEVVKKSQSEWPGLAFEDEQARRSDVRGWELLDNLLRYFSTCFTKPRDRLTLIQFLKSAIRSCKYSMVDRRLDVVEICPGTREDHLPVPVIFYLNLNSRVPTPPRASPFLKDKPLPAYGEKLALFQLLIGNASSEVYLSCPTFDDEGNDLAISPFITSLQHKIHRTLQPESIASWRPISVRNEHHPPKSDKKTQINSVKALAYMQDRSRHWSATQLDDAIQCPYLHFSKYLLSLSPLEDQIAQGINPLILGSIAHKALEELLKKVIAGQPFDLERWVRAKFRDHARRFPAHPEADRELEELVRNLNDFIEKGWARLSAQFEPKALEWRFGDPGLELDVSGGRISVEGRVDRIDVARDNSVLVTDYKYSRMDSEKKSEFFEGIAEGTSPQLPLYGLAVEKLWGRKIAAMLEIHLRTGSILGVRAEGFQHIAGVDEKGSEVREMSSDDLTQIYARAIETLEKTAEDTAQGRIQPRPADYRNCGPGKCNYADLCRYRQRWQKFL